MNENPDDTKRARITALAEELKALGGQVHGPPPGEGAPDPDLVLDFLEQVRRYELGSDRETTLARQLIAWGIALPPPDELDDAELESTLWRVIHGIARARTFLESTDHLSDRELYTHLWEQTLNEPADDISGQAHASYHVDLLGFGSAEGQQAWLRYYADDLDREDWQEQHAEALPPREALPHDRDRLLPKAW